MRENEAERRAIRIIQRLREGGGAESATVELKSGWIEPAKAARRIAAHCNAARGEPVLWLIGVAEDGKIVPLNTSERSDWWNQVKSHFDEVAPSVADFECSIEDQPFVVLVFQSDRSPYVVKVPSTDGKFQREVPWREATGARSAHRHEILSLFGTLPWQGSVRAFDARVENQTHQIGLNVGDVQNCYWFEVCLHFDHEAGGPLVLPLPRALVGVMPAGASGESSFVLQELWTRSMDDVGPQGSSQITIERSGSVVIGGFGILPPYGAKLMNLCVAIQLRTTKDIPVVRAIVPLVQRTENGRLPHWIPLDRDRWLDAVNSGIPFPQGLEKNCWFKIVAGR